MHLCVVTKGVLSGCLSSGWQPDGRAHTMVEGMWAGFSPYKPRRLDAFVQRIDCTHTEALLFTSPCFVCTLLQTFPCMSWLAPSSNRQLVSFDLLIQDSPEHD